MCPDCGSTRQALIFYGMPEFTDGLRARLEAGSIVLGGCCISGEDPEWRCLDCRREWGVSRQSRQLYELAGSGGSGAPEPLWVRLLSWIFIALLFVPVKALCIICFRILPAIHRAKVHCQQIVRRGSA
jgi:hypothetical protein